MDISEAFGLEFLDLSGVEEYERNRVLASLHLSKPNNKFPWFIGEENHIPVGLRSTKPNSLETPQQLANSYEYVPSVTETTSGRVPMPILNPEIGVTIPVNSNLGPVSNPESLLNSTVVNAVNDPVSQQLNSQYFSPVPQYYSPPVVTTIASVPVHIQPTSYGSNYTVPTTSHHEIPVNTTIYPTYLPQSYPVKAPVYYGVPPTQPIFVSHQTRVDAGSYYQSSTLQYVHNVHTENTASINVSQTPVESAPTHENQWVNNQSSVLNNNNQQQAVQVTRTNSMPSHNVMTKKTISPLSADTPAFTPKNVLNVSLASQNSPSSEPKGTLPEFENFSGATTTASLENTSSTVTQNVAKTDTPKQPGVWGAGKSWASLFTPKEGTVTPQVNGLTKPTLTEAVNKESNNNEVICPIKNPKKSPFIDPDCYRMGEFLANCTVDGRAVSLQPRGLINQSNYCYINSILQALIACPPMYNLLSGLSENISSNEKRKPTPVIDGICKFVKEFNPLPANMRVSNHRRSEGGKKDQKKDQGTVISTDIPFEPSWVYKMLNGIRTDLIEGRQEDAEEFLGCLLNNLNDEMLELIKLIKNEEAHESLPTQNRNVLDEDETWQVMGSKNKGSLIRKTSFERTPITDVFGGSLKSRIHRTGDRITENTQPFLTLQLNIEKNETVHQALEALTAKNKVEGVTSSKTNEEVEAWQQVMLDELPVVLVLHLKCFDFKLEGCTKIIKALEFPIDLKIDAKFLSSKTANAKEKQYKLFAVVYHDGKEATKGHYITDAFHVGYSSWLRYDDASVKQVQEEQVLNPQGTRVPYLLFYRRSDTIRSR